MFLIVGLGNVGEEYKNTRHNVGFMVIDELMKKNDVTILNKSNFTSVYSKIFINNKKVILCKPSTYMNLSGNAIEELINYYKIDLKDILVLYDDITLDIGKIRIRENGSSGGHNGIKHIINKFGTDKFKRIRVGIGENKNIELSKYVLSKFSGEEMKIIENSFKDIIQAIYYILDGDINKSMNLFN